MHSREDVVKLLLTKKGVDPYSTGGVSTTFTHLLKSTKIYFPYTSYYKRDEVSALRTKKIITILKWTLISA